jgi:hypothetical protein
MSCVVAFALAFIGVGAIVAPEADAAEASISTRGGELVFTAGVATATVDVIQSETSAACPEIFITPRDEPRFPAEGATVSYLVSCPGHTFSPEVDQWPSWMHIAISGTDDSKVYAITADPNTGGRRCFKVGDSTEGSPCITGDARENPGWHSPTGGHNRIVVSQAAAAFGVDPPTLSLGAASGSAGEVVQFYGTPSTWRVSTKPDWVTVSPDTGSSTTYPTIQATSPAPVGGPRSGDVVFTTGTETATMTVTQTGCPATFIEPVDGTQFPAEGGTVRYTVSCTGHTIRPEVDQWPSWIHVTVSGSEASTVYTITADLNTGAGRGFNPEWYSPNEVTNPIIVSQAAAAFGVYPPTLSLGAASGSAGEVRFYGAPNTWSVSTKPNWLTVSPDTGNSTTYPMIRATSAAPVGGSRSGVVVFTTGTETATVSVTQADLTFQVTQTVIEDSGSKAEVILAELAPAPQAVVVASGGARTASIGATLSADVGQSAEWSVTG